MRQCKKKKISKEQRGICHVLLEVPTLGEKTTQ